MLPEVELLFANLSRASTGGAGGETQPLVLLGAVGTGKSSILASVWQRLSEQEIHATSVALNSPRLPASLEEDHPEACEGGTRTNKSDATSLLAVFSTVAGEGRDGGARGEEGPCGGRGTRRPHVLITRFANISPRSRTTRGILAFMSLAPSSFLSLFLVFALISVFKCICMYI
jgi:GTPase SAR1 family protein